MAQKAKLSQAGETLQFKNLSDFAFAHAGVTGKVQDMAKYAIANIAGFPAECPEESKDELKAGYHKKWGTIHPEITFVNIGGNYIAEITLDASKLTGDHERRTISADYLMNLSTHEYGMMTKDDPEWRKIVGRYREAMKDYATNRFNDLVRAAKAVIAETTPSAARTRKIVLFQAAIKVEFDKLDKSAKVKQKNGDATADPLKFRMAVDAFWNVYNK